MAFWFIFDRMIKVSKQEFCLEKGNILADIWQYINLENYTKIRLGFHSICNETCLWIRDMSSIEDSFVLSR